MNDINIVDELKDFINEHINKMCVTELKNMKKWSIYCIEEIYDFNYKRLYESE